MKIPKASKPEYMSGGEIKLRIEVDGEEMDFIASPNDCEEHGRILYEEAIDGYFGPIAPYVPLTVDEIRAETAAQVRAERDRRLATDVDGINAVRWNAMTESQQAAWKAYRQALLDIPQQGGFPENVIWPDIPT